MPATQRGQAYRLGPNKWGLRYYDTEGVRRRKSPFPSKSAALAHYHDIVEPELRGDAPVARDLTLAEFIPLYLERPCRVGTAAHDCHAARTARPRPQARGR
jgi:hypothetical protein